MSNEVTESLRGYRGDVFGEDLRLFSAPTLIVGRKMRGVAERDVGATNSVDKRRWSDCTITA